MEEEARALVPRLEGHRVWMVNSAESGGGVAEMLPRVVCTLRELGVTCEWGVMATKDPAFFELTKRLHNLIHGISQREPTAEDRELYEATSREVARAMAEHLRPGDILAIHDPQPAAVGAFLTEDKGLPAIWRCHIGTPERNAITDAAWSFLQPYLQKYRRSLFSSTEYIPRLLSGRADLLQPGIDPLSHKNRELNTHRVAGILVNSQLAAAHAPVLTPAFNAPALRLGADGDWRPASADDELGLMYRPLVTQVSRWDRLKGFAPLMDAFVRLKQTQEVPGETPRERRRRAIMRLVLAGPDPESVADDPEGQEVLREIMDQYLALPASVQSDVAIITLPMASRKENALMVNAIQRCSSVVVQNSIREGFGLTATEAMWKAVPVVTSSASGLRQQVRDGLDGRRVEDPTDVDTLARVLSEVLADAHGRHQMGLQAQRRTEEEFLIFNQVSNWLKALVQVVGG